MIKLALLGLGRMGKEIIQQVQEDDKFRIVFGIEQNFKAVKDFCIPVFEPREVEQAIQEYRPDVVIDFSHPTATMEFAPILMNHNVNMVICTTGFTLDEQGQLKAIANESKGALLLAPNITPGINLLMIFSKIASQVLTGYDIQILDYHFKNKKDSPSGTARKLVKQLENEGYQANVYGIRAGGIIGKHKVLFAGPEDQIEINHEAYSIRIFARSALNAAVLLQGKQGFKEMKDILMIEEVIKNL